MIPTAYMRIWHVNMLDVQGRLQQLWAPTLGDETHFYPQAYLEENGAEWRDVPHVYPIPAVVQPSPTAFAMAAGGGTAEGMAPNGFGLPRMG